MPHAAPRFGRFDPKLIRKSLHTSLKQLNTERLDALLLHEILLAEVSDELKELIAAFKREGKIGKIGVATSVAETEVLIGAHPDLCEIVQVPVEWFEQPRTLPPGAKLIIHSVLSGAPGSPETETRGLERLKQSIDLNPDGVTLFSSRRHERIRRNAELLRTQRQATPAAPADTRTAVVIAAYNAEATLDRAVKSALAQPEAAEICIVDDGSMDQTAALARAWAARDQRVRAISLPANGGPSAARNAAIAATTSPWITILDADDYMLDGRLAELHRHINGADFIADALIRTDGDTPPPLPRAPLDPAPLTFTGFVLGNLGADNGPLDLGYLKPMFRRSFIEANKLAYRTDMRLGEDYEFYARALALGARFLVCRPAGYVSVERAGSLSKAHAEHDLQLLRDCDDSLAAIVTLNAGQRAALRRHWNSVDCRLQWRRLITAVKKRNVSSALSTFRSPQTIAYLAARLSEQVWVRGRKAANSWSLHNGLWPA
jgi:succinoglycan biosynthesis protein ExoU